MALKNKLCEAIMTPKRAVAMPLKKGKDAGKVRPYVVFNPDEYKDISRHALELDLEKGEYIRRAVLYVTRNKIDVKTSK